MNILESNNKSFSAWDIDVSLRQYSLWDIISQIEHQRINLYPEFQRNTEWDNIKKSRLIESLLIRLPLPVFYLNETFDDSYDVIDGLHRLTTFRSYVKGDFCLKNIEFFPELNDLKFEQLPIKFQRRIEEAIINVYIIKKGTPQNVIKNLFIRLNTTATIFNVNEIRHILHFDENLYFISNIIDNHIFTKTIQFPNKRLIHEELVLRFIGFYYYIDDYQVPLNEFLDSVIIQTKKFSASKKTEISHKLLDSLDILYNIFGNNIFKKNNSDRQILSLFEVWTVSIAKKTTHEINKIISNKNTLLAQYANLLGGDNYFIESITKQTTKKKSVLYRFNIINNLLNNILW